jgi:hypothetical protein
MPGKIKQILKKLKRKPGKNKVKKGIDPKTGYRYGYKPHYLSKEENIALGIGIGGSMTIPVVVTATKKKEYKKKNKNKKQFGGAVGPNGIL